MWGEKKKKKALFRKFLVQNAANNFQLYCFLRNLQKQGNSLYIFILSIQRTKMLLFFTWF